MQIPRVPRSLLTPPRHCPWRISHCALYHAPRLRSCSRYAYPPLAVLDIVRRVVGAGIFNHADLFECAQLSEKPLEMLRDDLEPNIFQVRMLRAALVRLWE
ncbi:hypothetical protein PsYK624_067370 [Phanerochaete sordida]|uniref:Uncharacterized protein n=1 Tax=Phanerochaete sordida TaxID=48140 RepID=A0A9P3G964_9APHY|nr:hypothetical protein PsYK624_067370 [Phanerochaete sordida]